MTAGPGDRKAGLWMMHIPGNFVAERSKPSSLPGAWGCWTGEGLISLSKGTRPVLTAGARGVVGTVVGFLAIFLPSLPTAKLLVAVLISFLIKEEQTSHFPRLA